MTEQNDKTPAQEQAPGKTRKKNLYHIVISCLCLVLVTALLLVGGSFSKYTETGIITNLKLKVAPFDIAVNEIEYADSGLDRKSEYSVDTPAQYILYGVTINNSSNIDIILDLVFETVCYENTDDEYKDPFYLIIDGIPYNDYDENGKWKEQEHITGDSEKLRKYTGQFTISSGSGDIKCEIVVGCHLDRENRYPNAFFNNYSFTITATQAEKSGEP